MTLINLWDISGQSSHRKVTDADGSDREEFNYLRYGSKSHIDQIIARDTDLQYPHRNRTSSAHYLHVNSMTPSARTKKQITSVNRRF